MTDRCQLNLRLDGRRDLLDSIKEIAAAQGLSLNTYVIRVLEQAAQGKTQITAGELQNSKISDITPTSDVILDKTLDRLLDSKVAAKFAAIEERLGKLSA